MQLILLCWFIMTDRVTPPWKKSQEFCDSLGKLFNSLSSIDQFYPFSNIPDNQCDKCLSRYPFHSVMTLSGYVFFYSNRFPQWVFFCGSSCNVQDYKHFSGGYLPSRVLCPSIVCICLFVQHLHFL